MTCLDMELRLIVSALGKYTIEALGPEDVWGASPALEGERTYDHHR